jgi:hypothetical protein
MLDIYEMISKCADRFLKISKATPVYLYHGTHKENLKSILSQGLIPNPKEKVWQEDPDAGWHMPSRESLGGIYLTSNLMTATGSANRSHIGAGRPRKRDNAIIVMVQVQPQSLLMDEDNLYGVGSVVLPGANVNEWLASTIYFDLKTVNSGEKFVDKSRAESLIQDAQTEYVVNALKHLEPKLKNKMNPNLKAALLPLLKTGFVLSLKRKLAHVEPAYYYRLWHNYAGTTSFPMPIQPNKSEAEREFKTYQDQLTRTLKTLARPANLTGLDSYDNFTARTISPIGFTKSNKIVAIFEILPEYSVKLIYPNNKSEIPPAALNKFISDWKENMSKNDPL